MRVYELTAHLQKISRAKGRTATAAAAYRSCSLIQCEREQTAHDYRSKAGLEASGIILPDGAPGWAADRTALWNAAELRERNGTRGTNAGAFKARAVTAREIMFGFPAELSAAGRLGVAESIARHLAATHQVATDFSIHLPGKDGDQRNHHCHMMLTTRRLTAEGLSEKTREWDDRRGGSATVTTLRAFVAETMNAALAHEGRAGIVHVEHRSHKARGTGSAPTRHQGPGKTNAARNRASRERTVWIKTTRERQAERQARERAALPSSGQGARELAERHAREDQQLARAITARVDRDRTMEAVARHTQVERQLQLDHQQEHGRSP